jgi:hypothetical protein
MTLSNVSLDSFEKYLEKVRVANRSRSKNIQLTIDEALELSTTIAQVITDRNVLLQQIVELQSKQSNDTKVSINGGSFT